MSKVICENCKTENEPEYVYCKNCGSLLSAKNGTPDKADDFGKNSYSRASDSSESFKFGERDSGNYDGVTGEDMAVFIGKKSVSILPHFTQMEISGSKISWCWPAAVLGLFFGPMGSALWFFYRKMYKPAAVLTVIGAVVTLLLDFAGQCFDLPGYSFDIMLSQEAEAYITGGISEIVGLSIISNVHWIIRIINCGITGMYGYYIYKSHCVKRIEEYRSRQGDTRFYKMGLSVIGGVSGGMLTFGIALMLLVGSMETILRSIIYIFSAR